MGTTTNKVVNGMAKVGRIRAKVTMVLLCVGAIALLVTGLVFVIRKDNTVGLNGTIVSASCPYMPPTSSNKTGYYNCSLSVTYTLAGKEYTGMAYDNASSPYNPGDGYRVRVDPKDPETVKDRPSYNTIGFILMGVAAASALGVLINWLITKSSTVSAAYGAKTLWNVLD